MTGIYKLAELNICIDSVFADVHDMLKDYVSSSDTFDFSVATVQQDIDFERIKSEKEDEKEGKAVIKYKDSYLETLAVYRKIAERLPEYSAFLFHGSCIGVDGYAYLFTAKSGTGKSTHAALWRKLLGDRAVMINDDKPVIRFTGDIPYIYGTPWDGKHHLSSNISLPLKAIYILERSENNSIEKISFGDSYPMLLQQGYRPSNAKSLSLHLLNLDKLKRYVSIYRLKCNMSIEAAKMAFEAAQE